MKAGIHPKYAEIEVTCSCGNKFKTQSTSGKPLHIEAYQLLEIAPSFVQHGDPREAGLKTFQQQEFEQPLRVAQRYAPFVIVIGDVEGLIVTPEAARHKAPRGGGGVESGILPGFPSQPKNR